MKIFKNQSYAPLHAARRSLAAIVHGAHSHPRLAAAGILVAALGTLILWTLLLPLPQAHGAYSISNSLRFDSAGSAYLSRTPAGAGNQQKWTLSMWVKRSSFVSTSQGLFDGHTNDSNATRFEWQTDTLRLVRVSGGSAIADMSTAAVFRDPAAWTHVVLAVDTTQATAANRVKMYVNGTQHTLSGTFPTQNSSMDVNAAVPQYIGRETNPSPTTFYYDGYMSDVYLIDGQQLTPSSFGQTESTTGAWSPISYSGTYGTNGFHLDFADSGTLGNDVSGNNNDYTANNLNTTDQVVDTPTNSFASLSPIIPWTNGGTFTTSEGNLKVADAATTYGSVGSILGISSGKWYWEVVTVSSGGSHGLVGIKKSNETATYPGGSAASYAYQTDGQKFNNSTGSAYGSTYTTGDLVGVALDADAGTLTFYKNGTTQGEAFTGLTNGPYIPVVGDQANATQYTWLVNFGQSASPTSTATVLPYRSAAGGYFLYAPPTGFKALSTANLPTPTIQNPKLYFDAVTYTGTGATQSVSLGATQGSTVRVYLTSGTSWTVPNDFNPYNNTIEVIGGGGGGGEEDAGRNFYLTGGGGGAYSKTANVSLTPGASVTYAVGAAGAGATSNNTAGGTGGDSYFCNSSSNCASISGTAVIVGAKGGQGGQSAAGGTGGASASGVGTTKYSGGAGGTNPGGSYGGSGGGGAAGPNGAGGTGGTNTGAAGGCGVNGGAGGGGGNGGGSNGGNASGATGGNGGNNSSGSGGATGPSSGNGPAGTNGGGGAGGGSCTNPGYTGGAGGAGTEWDATHGSGGGGGGGTTSTGGSNTGGAGGNAGSYGGGGGGGGDMQGAGGNGSQGIVVITYTSTHTGFQPALTWLKDRTSANSHGLFDAVRGATQWLASNSTAAEATDADTLTAFNADGFSLGADAKFNTNTNSYISWNWKESATSGFDIVTYTGNGANRTIAHSLGTAPDMIIVKDRSGANDWAVYHSANTAAPETDLVLLNSTAATADDATYWNDTAPTASVFSVSTNADVNTNTNNYVAYLFDEVDGFSKFGSYTGNGAADGPFIYTGFKPRFIMWKNTNAASQWRIHDTAREPNNPSVRSQRANATNAEDTSGAGDTIDILSNGFKVRTTGTDINDANTYIYAAFADIPFKYATAGASATDSFIFFEF